jgi:hypothetical protein
LRSLYDEAEGDGKPIVPHTGILQLDLFMYSENLPNDVENLITVKARQKTI